MLAEMVLPSLAAGLVLSRLVGFPFGFEDDLPVVPGESAGPIPPEVLLVLAFNCVLLTALLCWWSRRQYLRLPELPPMEGQTTEDCVVVIPARNEQATIARAMAGFAGFPVCVVDDASTDYTAERAAVSGARVLPASPPPPGWLGKNNACWTGTQQTHSKWILFTDGDTACDPRFLPSLIEYARTNSLQAVSVFPKPVGGSRLARLLCPCASGLSFAGLSAERINSAQSRQSLQSSRYLLFLRSGYEFIGGHRRICGSIPSDLALAALLQAHRIMCRTVRCETLTSVRRYDSAAALWSGMQRWGCRFPALTPGGRIRLLLAATLHAAWLPVLAVLLYAGSYAGAALFYLAVALSWLPWYGRSPLVLLSPWAVYAILACAKLGVVKHFLGLPIAWKGRRV